MKPQRPYCPSKWTIFGSIQFGCIRRKGHTGRHKTRWGGAWIVWPVAP